MNATDITLIVAPLLIGVVTLAGCLWFKHWAQADMERMERQGLIDDALWADHLRDMRNTLEQKLRREM